MNPIKVLIYEDQPEAAENWENKIGNAYEAADINSAGTEDFHRLLKLLNHRRAEWRNGGSEGVETETHEADTADLIVVDFDLLRYSDTGDTTGSRLAYLLRCFSKCGFIIIINEYGTNVFDLSLGCPTEDFADVHAGDVQIGNPGLWRVPFDGYRPWYWPVVPNARKNFEQCVTDVGENPDAPILQFLGLDRVIDWIPRRARDFLLGKQKIEDVTFRGFVESGNGGISGKDRLTPEQMARVAAARIVTLLNSIILPEQSALVDAPHLVSRFPSLIRNRADDIEMWNMLCNPVAQNIDDLLAEGLKKHKFRQLHWLWRPAWFWSEINKDEDIEEVKDPWSIKEVDWVFCEDISRFVLVRFARHFSAVVSPPFIKRFVFRSNSPDANSCVGQIGYKTAQDPSIVEYVPQALFSV